MKTSFAIVLGLMAALPAGDARAGSGFDIPQVPATARQDQNTDDSILKGAEPAEATGGDYQAEVLSNPTISAPARASAVMEENGFGGGNSAVIVQKGGHNYSSIKQSGTNNSASQIQEGHDNDLRVEQYGKHNRSDERQIGAHNHKVKVQNGERQEETTIEQVAPDRDNANDNQ
jgi:hypothetical protein